jgi:hypothetical protein
MKKNKPMKTLKQKLGIITVILLLSAVSFAQNEGVSIKASAGAPHKSAMLDVESATKGLLIPRVNLVNITNNVTPVSNPTIGLLVYNLTSSITGGTGFFFWNGSAWMKLANGYNNELWSIDPTTPNSSGIFRTGTVSIGQSTIAVPGTNPATSTLQVFGPSVFYAQGPAPNPQYVIPSIGSGTFRSFGLHIGDPNNNQNVGGGHANEINHYYEPLDLQWFTKTDVRIGAFGGSNLDVSQGWFNDPNMGFIHASRDITAGRYLYSQYGLVTTSDSTLKTNITQITDVLPNLSHLNTYSYNYKTEGAGDQKHIGVIAQEVEQVFDLLVTARTTSVTDFSQMTEGGKSTAPVTTTTKKAVDYLGLTAILLQAIKEQQVIIDDLKNRVQALEQR